MYTSPQIDEEVRNQWHSTVKRKSLPQKPLEVRLQVRPFFAILLSSHNFLPVMLQAGCSNAYISSHVTLFCSLSFD